MRQRGVLNSQTHFPPNRELRWKRRSEMRRKYRKHFFEISADGIKHFANHRPQASGCKFKIHHFPKKIGTANSTQHHSIFDIRPSVIQNQKPA